MANEQLPGSRRPYVRPTPRPGEWVPDSRFITMGDAAAELGIGSTHKWLLTFNHLPAVKNRNGDLGVTRECIDRELAFCQSATRWQRLKRVLKNLPGP